MKLLLDHHGLQRAAEGVSEQLKVNFSSEILNRSETLSLWTTVDSVSMVCRILDAHHGRNDATEFFNEFVSQCTVIPIRKSNISDALKSIHGELYSNINISIARQFNLDCILTEHPEDYHHGDIPAVLLNDFSPDLECSQTKDSNNVPFMNLKAPYDKIYPEIDERITHTIADSRFILGPYVDEFEKTFAGLQEAEHCIGVSSGTAALHIALMALGIGPGDHVLLPVNTFIATAEAVSLVGATPVFVDCDEYYNIGAEKVRETITMMASKDLKSPKALIPVHLYGQPVDMGSIMDLAAEFELVVIEDACQAHLARFEGTAVGQFGTFGAFSFYPGKNLGSFGEAGALVTNDEALYEKAKMLRQHGELERYRHAVIGHNYRMSAIQGAVLATKSKYLPEWTRKRQAVARRYNEILADIEEIDLPKERKGTECVHHLYVIQSDRRDELREFLDQNGIATGIHYPYPLHKTAAYSHLRYRENDFPVAERAARRILSLPMYPELGEPQIVYVRDKIKEFYSGK